MQIVDLSRYDQSGYDRGRPGWFIQLWWLVQATIFQWSPLPCYGFRNGLLRLFGAKIGRGVKVRSDAHFYFPWKITLGDNTWVGNGAVLYSLAPITVGTHCVISQEAYLNTGSHELTDPHFRLIIKPIVLEDGVWVGTRAFVTLGVTIRRNAVIGAMSMVTREMPANMVCVGNPCRPLRQRGLVVTPDEDGACMVSSAGEG